jgi:hypothetical protein
MQIPEGWLQRANERYRRDEIPHRVRPFKALREVSAEFGVSINLSSATAKEVFEWFKQRSAPEAHQVGSLFTGSFFFDVSFWPVSVPVAYGNFKLNPLEALETMPDPVKKDLCASAYDLQVYMLYWADCVDYGYGLEDLRKLQPLSRLAMSFLANADRELHAAVTQVITPRPNYKAGLAARMATEIFLKTFLIAKCNLTEEDVKHFSHDIGRIANRCHEVTPLEEFKTIINLAHLFPVVDSRYTGEEQRLHEVWNGISLCQVSAAAVIRQFSDRDIRPQLISACSSDA